MLKVDLLKDKSSKKGAKKQASGQAPNADTSFKDIFGDELEVDGASSVGTQVGKLALIFGFLVAMYGYEMKENADNKKVIQSKNIELEDLQKLLQEKKESVTDLDQLKVKNENQAKYIENVKAELTERMHTLKGLDYIQSAIVSDLWLTSINYSTYTFKLEGKYINKISLDSFYRNLNRVPLFGKSLIIKDSEANSSQNAIDFSILTNVKKNLSEFGGDDG